jgi:hypothetical protein
MWVVNLAIEQFVIFFFKWFTKAINATLEALETNENILSPQKHDPNQRHINRLLNFHLAKLQLTLSNSWYNKLQSCHL